MITVIHDSELRYNTPALLKVRTPDPDYFNSSNCVTNGREAEGAMQIVWSALRTVRRDFLVSCGTLGALPAGRDTFEANQGQMSWPSPVLTQKPWLEEQGEKKLMNWCGSV
ncbi:hypothetical protein DPEC_G00003100 [Dallia pectoralis]|uniref:Uncharacterized protein n=1 Tax=Dallia pectoralis TaxID=75939 RepID=A0ACC2HJX5_DALPE|nr:hypothetical protein DPEC_G00003100 [Dallia pectoralis]